MKDVNIYLYTEYKGSLKSGNGKYHIMLETIIETGAGKEPRTLGKINVLHDVTKNKMELLAMQQALEILKEPCRLTIYTASDYLINAWEKGWLERWKTNGFTSRGKPVRHADIWEHVAELEMEHEIHFVKTDRTSYTQVQAFALVQINKK